jgi:hypothetical protein
VSDFLTELRREVVGAHTAHRRRSRLRRAVRGLWRPGPLLGAAAAALALLALVVGVRALRAPEPTGGPRVLGVVDLGGNPVDGAFHDGSLWVADFRDDAIVRLDPVRRRIQSRIRLRGEPGAIAAGGGGLWVRTWRSGGDRRTDVSHIDSGSERVVARVTTGFGWSIAVGPDTVWAAKTEVPPEGIDGIDARTAERTRLVRVPHVYGLAATAGALWALMGDGTVVQADATTGRVQQRWPQLAVSNPDVDNENSIVADDRGAWVLASGMGVRALLVRVEDGEATKRIPVDPQALPVVTAAFRGVWIASRPEPRGPYRLSRLDPATGETTASVAIGIHRPVALVPAGDVLCAVSGGGSVVVVDPGDD